MNKKFGLGKGLNALIPEDSEIDESSRTFVSINMIKANFEQPRKKFNDEKILALSESIKEHGIIQPIILQKENDVYKIVAGERRWRAAKLAGLKEVPAIIMDLTSKDVLELSLIENVQREDLNPIEEAKAYNKLISDFNITQEELSLKVGRSRVAVTNCLRLLNLDERVQDYLIDEVITEGHGRCLLSINDGEIQYKTCQRIIDEGLSVRQTEQIVRAIINNTEKKVSNISKIDELKPYYNEIKDRLENYFGTKVSLQSKKDKGKILIEYYSKDDLERIIEILKL